MKSLTKNIYTLTVLVAMLLLSCSKEDRYLCSDNDPTPLTTRSVVSLDSLNKRLGGVVADKINFIGDNRKFI